MCIIPSNAKTLWNQRTSNQIKLQKKKKKITIYSRETSSPVSPLDFHSQNPALTERFKRRARGIVLRLWLVLTRSFIADLPATGPQHARVSTWHATRSIQRSRAALVVPAARLRGHGSSSFVIAPSSRHLTRPFARGERLRSDTTRSRERGGERREWSATRVK